jgi:eukaryotic-like serine/threonine-protein kinase
MTSSDPPDSPYETDLGDDPFSTRHSDVEADPKLADSVRRLGDYQLLRQLGRGGMGVVYEAVHINGGPPVALKTLQQQSASAIHRFKDEFRVLADLSHKNLVRLGELVTTSDEPFFTMEIIHGSPFNEFIHASFASANALPNLPFNELRLRDALKQLADGLTTLHEAGCIHRDLKPTNVLVTNEGRVVILDFGLALDVDDAAFQQNQSKFAGTPYYMSPEQTRSKPVTAASDWYSIGIMLYEALTGEHAFQSRRLSELIREKLDSPTLRPHEVQPEIPLDLSQLCIDLLQVDPELRPTGHEIRARLSGTKHSEVSDQVWIGRTSELAQLQKAWQDVRQGETRVVLVGGNSGMGKTSLVDRFLSELRQDEPVIVLRGRCYDNESVAYQGFDSVVDSLSDHLRRMPASDVERLLPMELDSLTQIFPVLCEVPAISRDVLARPNKKASAAERRRLGMAALREMLSRLCRWSSVVMFIDDLQQGDADTAALFREILPRDQAPRLLFLGTYRTEDLATSECLSQILRSQLAATEQLQLSDQIEISVDRFDRDDSVRLASSLLLRGANELPTKRMAIHCLSVCSLAIS